MRSVQRSDSTDCNLLSTLHMQTPRLHNLPRVIRSIDDEIDCSILLKSIDNFPKGQICWLSVLMPEKNYAHPHEAIMSGS